MRYLIYAMIILTICAGCANQPSQPDGLPIEDRNFTLILQCADAGNLSMKVRGNAYVNKYDFGKSNCSMHISNGTMRLKCPREPLRISRLAREGEKLLNRSSQK